MTDPPEFPRCVVCDNTDPDYCPEHRSVGGENPSYGPDVTDPPGDLDVPPLVLPGQLALPLEPEPVDERPAGMLRDDEPLPYA